MRIKLEFDVPGVFRDFMRGRLQDRRAQLMREFNDSVNRGIPEVKALLAEVGAKAMENNLGPVHVLGLGLTYGLALGVLLKERNLKVQ